jgi:hypothetical protein
MRRQPEGLHLFRAFLFINTSDAFVSEGEEVAVEICRDRVRLLLLLLLLLQWGPKNAP